MGHGNRELCQNCAAQGPHAPPRLQFRVFLAQRQSRVPCSIAARPLRSALAVGFREYKRVIRGRDIPLWSFIKASKDPSLYRTLLEDFSAIAALGVIASSVLQIGWADGAASIAISVLLVGVSAVISGAQVLEIGAIRTRSDRRSALMPPLIYFRP